MTSSSFQTGMMSATDTADPLLPAPGRRQAPDAAVPAAQARTRGTTSRLSSSTASQ
jgi:hypothetical protein